MTTCPLSRYSTSFALIAILPLEAALLNKSNQTGTKMQNNHQRRYKRHPHIRGKTSSARTAARAFLAARTHGIRIVNILVDNPRVNCHLVVPARVVKACCLPRPEDLFICQHSENSDVRR